MYTVYKSGSRVVKARFGSEYDAREYHRLNGGDLVKNCSSDDICDYCMPCQCGHKADEHLAGDGHCFICKCEQFTDELTELVN